MKKGDREGHIQWQQERENIERMRVCGRKGEIAMGRVCMRKQV